MPTSRELSSLEKEQINVLLHEYDSLRHEIVSRTNNRFAIGGILVAVAGFVCSQPEVISWVRWCVGLVGLICLGILWFAIGLLIEAAACRIAEIESKVNTLLGEELLVHESRGKRRWFGACGPRFRPGRPK